VYSQQQRQHTVTTQQLLLVPALRWLHAQPRLSAQLI
jgi:hypothetical protein